LFYKEIGNIHGVLFVFIHGGQTDNESLVNIADHFLEFDCLLPDLPGHGESFTESFSIEKSIDEIMKLINKKRENKKVVIFGHSLGAIIVRQLVTEYPSVADLAILGSGTIIPDIGYYLSRSPLYVIWKFRKNSKYYKKVKLTKKVFDREMKEIIKYAYPNKRLDDINIPVLLIHGSKEKKFIKKSSKILSEHIKYSEIREIRNAGHCYNRDNENELVAELTNFINNNLYRNLCASPSGRSAQRNS
jgi:pimeloyl-ACP methyl ester carboxylesterase